MKITNDQLKSIVSKLSGIEPEQIKEDMSLIEDLHFDSLKIVELLAILSEEHQIEVSEEDAMGFHSYKQLFDYTQRQI